MVAALACAPEEGEVIQVGGDAMTRGDGTITGGLDGGSSDGGSAADGDVTPVPLRDASILTVDAACATQTFSSTRAPATLMVLLDRSNSMNDPIAAGRTRWDAARAGLSRLIMRLPPETRVGLMFFPTDLVAVPTAGDSAANYQRPSVAVAPLSTQRPALLARLAAARAEGRTPMACALPGAIAQLAALPGDGPRNVVLITDGAPTFDCTGRGRCATDDAACLAEVTRLAQGLVTTAARNGATRTPPVRTFTLGTPDALETFLSDVATAGGTPRAASCGPASCHYSLANASFEADLDRALDAVRGRTATCEYEISVDPARADPNLINVRFTPAGGVERIVPRDRAHANGWDYGAGMRTVVFYGAVCDEIRADAAGTARVQILYGCLTVAPP